MPDTAERPCRNCMTDAPPRRRREGRKPRLRSAPKRIWEPPGQGRSHENIDAGFRHRPVRAPGHSAALETDPDAALVSSTSSMSLSSSSRGMETML